MSHLKKILFYAWMLSVILVAFGFYNFFSIDTQPIEKAMFIAYFLLLSFTLLSARIALSASSLFSKIIIGLCIVSIAITTFLFFNSEFIPNIWYIIFILAFLSKSLILFTLLEKKNNIHRLGSLSIIVTMVYLLTGCIGLFTHQLYYNFALVLLAISTLLILTAQLFFKPKGELNLEDN